MLFSLALGQRIPRNRVLQSSQLSIGKVAKRSCGTFRKEQMSVIKKRLTKFGPDIILVIIQTQQLNDVWIAIN